MRPARERTADPRDNGRIAACFYRGRFRDEIRHHFAGPPGAERRCDRCGESEERWKAVLEKAKV